MKKVVLLITAALATLAGIFGMRKSAAKRDAVHPQERAGRHRIVKLDEHELSAYHGN